MSTTDRAVPGRNDLAEVKRRRLRENLLYSRKRLAQLAAEYRSHCLYDDAVELYLLQLEVEQVIADELPEEFGELAVTWAEVEAVAEHHPLVISPDCTLCAAVVTAETQHLSGPLAA